MSQSPNAQVQHKEPVDLSVIVPSYRSQATLGRCLDSLVGLDPPVKEIIVVDSSPDFPLQEYRKRYPQVRFIHLPERAFPGKARNIGAAAATSSVLAFLDADCIVPPDWAACIVRACENLPRHAVFAAVLKNANPQRIIGWLHFLSEFSGYVGSPRRRRVKCLHSACLVFPRSVFLRSGGFPAELARGEDAVLTRRLAGEGVSLFLEPTVKVAHVNPSDLRAFFKRQYLLGYAFSVTRVLFPHYTGGRLLNRSAWLIPPLAAYRAAAIACRLLRDYPVGFLILVLGLPLYLAGCTCWLAGSLSGRRATQRVKEGNTADCVADLMLH